MSDTKTVNPPLEKPSVPAHIAIIMDGNGRWAKERGMPRIEGHRKGIDAVRNIVRIAGDYGIKYLTLYSFSSENWNRPESEISELFGLLRFFVRKHLAELHQNNVCLKVIGEKQGVPDDIVKLLDDATNLTSKNNGLTLVIAFNYGARTEILNAAKKVAEQIALGEFAIDELTCEIFEKNLQTKGIPDPDLIIRTSGEQRLSNFLLWQAAYSEFVFTPCKWPDFDEQTFQEALNDYNNRDRRFGAVSSVSGSG